MNGGYIAIRSLTDRLAAGVLLALFSPLFAVISVAVFIKMGRPIIFRQERVGRGGRVFHIVKFRTMVPEAETLGGGYMPPDLNLVPPLGALLRRTSLDELPQLLNIVRGEMSFVGPRPALVEQYRRYTPEQADRVTVPQGVTGLAQVRFRNNAPWSQRIEADLEYVHKVGFPLDLSILLETVGRVIRADGVRLDQVANDVDDLPRGQREGETL